MSTNAMKIHPDQIVTFKTQVEVDNANKLYEFIVKQKENDHRYYERRIGRPIKMKSYSENRFLKEILLQGIDDIIKSGEGE